MAIETKINEDEYTVNASVHKKETDWGQEHNYIGDGELRITITLDEYRELLTENATMKEKLRALQVYVDGLKAKAKIEEEDDF